MRLEMELFYPNFPMLDRRLEQDPDTSFQTNNKNAPNRIQIHSGNGELGE